MLSAQTTDKRVNIVTGELYKKYDSLLKLNELTTEELNECLKTIGFHKTKSNYFKEIVSKLLEKEVKLAKELEKETTVLLQQNFGTLKQIAESLLENETLYDADLCAIINSANSSSLADDTIECPDNVSFAT